jgi:hypothetical protein
MVMRTLKDIPETTPIPKLAEAARLALQISVNAQVRFLRDQVGGG